MAKSGDLYPPFVLGSDLYDRTTFEGRFRHFIKVIDPFSLAKSDEEIKAAEKLLVRSRVEADGGIPKGATNKSK